MGGRQAAGCSSWSPWVLEADSWHWPWRLGGQPQDEDVSVFPRSGLLHMGSAAGSVTSQSWQRKPRDRRLLPAVRPVLTPALLPSSSTDDERQRPGVRDRRDKRQTESHGRIWDPSGKERRPVSRPPPDRQMPHLTAALRPALACVAIGLACFAGWRCWQPAARRAEACRPGPRVTPAPGRPGSASCWDWAWEWG